MRNLTIIPLRATLMLFALLAINTSMADEFEANGIYYYTSTIDLWGNPTEEHAIAFDCKDDINHLVIPEKVVNNGKTYIVSEIAGLYSFENKTSIKSVVIGDSVQNIYTSFNNCTNLSSLTVGLSVSSFYASFSGCSIKTLIYNARNCPAFWERCIYYPFDNLEHVVIGNNVETIPDGFCSGTRITEIVIPKSVKTIGKDCWKWCHISSIAVDEENTHFDSRGNCNAIIETATNTLIKGCQSTTIPNNVSIIGESAFEYCSELTDIVIPNSVIEIGDCAFKGCTGLTSIEIPNSVVRLGDFVEDVGDIDTDKHGAFNGCSGLTTISLPSSLEIIGDCSFYECTELTNVSIPDFATTIGNCAFRNCTNLNEIIVPNSVFRVGYSVLDGTVWYENQPDGMLYIGLVACGYKGVMPDNSTITLRDGTLGISQFCLEMQNNLVELKLPSTLKYIGFGALVECKQLKEISIPNSVKWLESWAFGECSNLKSATIGNSVETVPVRVFYRCDNLQDITIGSGVKTIEYDAFHGCKAITKVTCLAMTPPAMEDVSCFDEDNYTNAVLLVPKGSEAAYMSADNWKKFIHILGIDTDPKPGDVNGDHEINIADINQLVDAILAGKHNEWMDVNGDGEINIADVNQVVQIILDAN